MILAGVDIGGTERAVCLGRVRGEQVDVIGKQRGPTPPTPTAVPAQILVTLDTLSGDQQLTAIGISCG